MTTNSDITRSGSVAPLARNPKPLAQRLLDWLADRNARYVAAQRAAEMTNDQLKDVGLSRQEMNQAFYGARGKVADNAPAPIITSILSRH